MKTFFTAFSTLTILPVPCQLQSTKSDLAGSVVYFPLVGLALGSLLVGLSYPLRSVVAPLPLAVCLLFVSVIFTGALHLDGVADLCDGFGAGGTQERMLSVMKESQIGAFGVIGVVLVLLFKFSLFFEIIDKGRWPIFLLMALLSRWSMTLAAFLGKYPRAAGTGLAFIGKIRPRQIFFATILTLLLSGGILGVSGLAAMALSALTTVSFVFFLKRKLGGITGDGLGALNEQIEVLVMLFMFAIPTFGVWKIL